MRLSFYIRFHTSYGQNLSIKMHQLHQQKQIRTVDIRMSYLNDQFWKGTVDMDVDEGTSIQYQYLLHQDDGTITEEWGNDRIIELNEAHLPEYTFIDSWNHAGAFENVFLTNPFTEVLLQHSERKFKNKSLPNASHTFKVKAPLLQKNEVVCIIGNNPIIGNWDPRSAILLKKQENWWTTHIDLSQSENTILYKYGVFNTKSEKFVRFEDGENREIPAFIHSANCVIHDGFLHLPNTYWKGAGVAIPVFSLRTSHSMGVGEFTDIRLLVDWAKKVGMKLIQILPVNDTTATHSWQDSYPYAAISAFALHPMYLNLNALAGKKFETLLKPLKIIQKELNDQECVDYEGVMKVKMATAKELYKLMWESIRLSEDYQTFFSENEHWLVPYAAFCKLRDQYGTADFNQWEHHGVYNKASMAKFTATNSKHYDEIAFWYFLQYHLHLQLKDAADYAHEHKIILKGDIPIGIYRYGVDAWVDPSLYHMNLQAGAPPDDFAVKGQNWGFPTYNWEQMAKDGFQWWYKRFVQMGNYFDAFRIDHILGFFRIWSIPLNAVEGIMGYFVPAIPVHINEFSQKGISFDHYRFCKPFIVESVVHEIFGEYAFKAYDYLEKNADGNLQLKDAFTDQKKVEAHFLELPSTEENARIKQGLFDVLSNVLLFEIEGSDGQSFHFRFNIDQTTSFKYLDSHIKEPLKDLYIDYFFKRQDQFWKKEAMQKLPALKRSTNMLICGEDLGLVPGSVPEVMQQLGILSLEIQRMPKTLGKEFFHPSEAPYLSVVTPSTHDMSTIRGWWEEDRDKTQRFYNQELRQWGSAPPCCEPWINRAIVLQHFYAPAMWSIFQLQDLFGISETLRRSNPHDERINIPANPKHYWQYRIHVPLEDLLSEKEFNREIKDYIVSSGRGEA